MDHLDEVNQPEKKRGKLTIMEDAISELQSQVAKMAKQLQILTENKADQDSFDNTLAQKVDKKTFYDVLHFVVNNFEGAKEFVNAKVGTVTSAQVQTTSTEPLEPLPKPIESVGETDQKHALIIDDDTQEQEEVVTPSKSEKKINYDSSAIEHQFLNNKSHMDQKRMEHRVFT